MGKTLKQKIAELPPDRQTQIQTRTKELIEAYILKRGYVLSTAIEKDFIKEYYSI